VNDVAREEILIGAAWDELASLRQIHLCNRGLEDFVIDEIEVNHFLGFFRIGGLLAEGHDDEADGLIVGKVFHGSTSITGF
jgi:hypothetical protein